MADGVVSPFDAIILAGGRATRAGGIDKPGQLVGGRTLVGAVAAAAVSAGAQRLIVAGPDRPDLAATGPTAPDGLRFVREDPPGSGPVAALRAALPEVGAPVVALLAADLPFLTARQFAPLLAELAGGAAGALLLDDEDRPQWLLGCWRVAVLADALAEYRGRSLRGLLGPLAPVALPCPRDPSEPPPWLDCDTPHELALARRLAARSQAGPERARMPYTGSKRVNE